MAGGSSVGHLLVRQTEVVAKLVDHSLLDLTNHVVGGTAATQDGTHVDLDSVREAGVGGLALDQRRPQVEAEEQVGMGRIDDAFEVIFLMLEQPDPLLLSLMAYTPYYSALHADPRYNEVRKRMGLPER